MKVFCHFCDIGQVNTYVVTAGERDCRAIVIDPGDLDGGLIDIIESYGLEVAALLVTHDHEQHVAGIGKYMKVYPCPVYAYRSKVMGYGTRVLRETMRLDIEGFQVDVLHVPGHSDDSLVYGHRQRDVHRGHARRRTGLVHFVDERQGSAHTQHKRQDHDIRRQLPGLPRPWLPHQDPDREDAEPRPARKRGEPKRGSLPGPYGYVQACVSGRSSSRL